MRISCLIAILFCLTNAFSQNLKFTDHLIERLDQGVGLLKNIDFDGDGDKDFVQGTIFDLGQGLEFKWYENVNGEFRVKYINGFDEPVSFDTPFSFFKNNNSEVFDIYIYDYLNNKIIQYHQDPQNKFSRNKFFDIPSSSISNFEIININNDNSPDLVVFEKNEDIVSLIIYINNGNSFTRIDLGIDYDNLTPFNMRLYTEIYLQDMNSDGLMDIVYSGRELVDEDEPGTYDDYIIYLKNNGDTSFEKINVGRLTNLIQNYGHDFVTNLFTFYDIDNNGLFDIYYTDNIDFRSKPHVFNQDIEDNFIKNTIDISLPNSRQKIHVINQKNDQNIDLISTPLDPSGHRFVNYHKNNGDNTYSSTTLFSTVNNGNVIVTDIDHNGLEDIVISENFKLYQYKQTPSLDFQRKEFSNEFYGEIKLLETYNFNNDRHKEIIAVSIETSRLYMYLNHESFNFDKILIDDVDDIIAGIASIDFNNDGLQDILTIANEDFSAPAVLNWYENVNSEYFRKNTITTLDGDIHNFYSRAQFKDLDNDGDFDIIINGEFSLDWYENTDNKFSKSKRIINNWAFADQDYNFIDFDSDGDIDITYSAKECHFIRCFFSTVWFEMNDNHDYIKHNIIDKTDRYYKTFKPADINNNGLIDFIVVDENFEQFIWINQGSGYQIVPFSDFFIPTTTTRGGISLNDINKDGLIDIISFNKIFINQGDLHFSETEIDHNFTAFSSYKKLLVDINSDGLTDILFDLERFFGGIKLLKQVSGNVERIPAIGFWFLVLLILLIILTTKFLIKKDLR